MAIIYVTKDTERATGIDLNLYPDVYVLTNASPLANLWQKIFPERIILNKESHLSTLDLLKKFKLKIEETLRQAQGDTACRILVFKNTAQIERFCNEQGWQLLNSAAELSEKFERKLSQLEWFKSLNINIEVPESIVDKLEKLRYEELSKEFGSTFLLQYNLGHTGEGTKIISSPYDLEKETQATPKREIKVSKFIKGKTYTVNACVGPNEIYIGQISLQLTGLKNYTDNLQATAGTDWSAATKLYSKQDSASSDEQFIPEVSITENINIASQIEVLTKTLGQAMRIERWLGLFGVDVLLEENTNKLYLIEVNARQSASATFETQLAHTQEASGPLDWQLHSLADVQMPLPKRKYEIKSSQVFLRKTSGPAYDKFKSISQVGEYSPDLNLIKENLIFNLKSENRNLFLIPQSTEAEVIRIQANKFDSKGFIISQ